MKNNTNKTTVSFRLMFLGIFLLALASLSQIIWKEILGGAYANAGYFLYPLSFLIFFVFSLLYIFRERLLRKIKKLHKILLLFYFIIIFISALYGFGRGNIINYIVHDSMMFLSIGIFLILGTDDRFTGLFIKFLTVMFWISFFLCLFTFKIPAKSVHIFPWESVAGFYGRYTKSIAYHFFRAPMFFALPLFIYGWLEKKRIWRYLQISSLMGFLIVNVMIFKFRGSLILAVLVATASLLMPGKLTRKLKIIGLAFILVIAILGWLNTEQGAIFVERTKQFDKTDKVVHYRLPEAIRYFEVMGKDWLIGHGLGGTFKYDNSEWGRNRTGVHIGWITFTLKGGLPLLICMLCFFAEWLKRPRRYFEKDIYFTTAWFWTPIAFVNWLVNPISIEVRWILVYGLTFTLMARFGKSYIDYQ